MGEPCKTDVFLTHDWGKDEKGRGNHDRVAVVNEALKSLGYKTWFDSDRMSGDIMQQMASGIDNTKIVLVFITQRYAQKVGGTNEADNCKLEFQYATRMKTKALMVPIIMEDRMKRPSEWTGPVGFALGGELALRMTFDFSDDKKFKAALAELKQEIDVRLKKLDAVIPDKPVPAPVPAPAPSPAPAKDSEIPTPLYGHIYHALLRGAAENIKLKKSDGHGAGKYLYLRKDNQLDLTSDKEKANDWSVKPKRQYGKLGFSIVLFKRLDGQESFPALTLDQDSNKTILNDGCYENEESDFWAVVPTRGNEKSFQIVNMTCNGPLVAEWCKRGNYVIQCQETGIGSATPLRKKVEHSLWEFESSTLLKSYSGQQVFSKVYVQSIMNEKPLKITNFSSGQSLQHDAGKLSLSRRGNSSWRLFPWQHNTKSYIMIASDGTAKFQLAVDTDGESVKVSEGLVHDVECQDNKWGLVPVEVKNNQVVYLIRKSMGGNAGARLAVKDGSGKIVCTQSKGSDYSSKWILSM